jgi:hypothetical protein
MKVNGQKLLNDLNEMLVSFQSIANPTASQRQTWQERIRHQEELLTKYLRTDGPNLNWDVAPIARDYYTQN